MIRLSGSSRKIYLCPFPDVCEVVRTEWSSLGLDTYGMPVAPRDQEPYEIDLWLNLEADSVEDLLHCMLDAASEEWLEAPHEVINCSRGHVACSRLGRACRQVRVSRRRSTVVHVLRWQA
jgi:hypothetical protein